MSEWTNPRYAATVRAYREARAAEGHPRPPRSRWGRRRVRRCAGCVMVVDPATGIPFTLPCGCPRPA